MSNSLANFSSPSLDTVPHKGNNPLIRLTDVSKFYESGKGRVEALRDINLNVEEGEIFGIIGRSGAGKSTLIRTMNRLESVSSGSVTVGGVDLGGLDRKGLVAMRRTIGMIFQHFNLLGSQTVYENLALPLKSSGVKPHVIRERAHKLLRLVGLEDKQHAYPSRLSGGQKQRVGIARALMLEPKVILCDEATSALDPESTSSILTLLKDINRELGITIVLITHEMSVIRKICDRVAVIDKGRIVESGPVWEIFGRPKNETTQALLDAGNDNRSYSLQDEGVAYLSLTFDGKSTESPNIYAIGQALGSEAMLVHASMDIVQGRSIGKLVFATRTGVEKMNNFINEGRFFSKAEVKICV